MAGTAVPLSVETETPLVTFAEFIATYDETASSQFELIQGVVVEMMPTGSHEEIISFLRTQLVLELCRLQRQFVLPTTYFVKSPLAHSSYRPDVLLLDKAALKKEPDWQKSAVIRYGRSTQLAIEVVSTNWRHDYLTKLADYESLAIPEYWIVDYLGLGGSRYIGRPKRPTISVYQLVDSEYQVQQFREDEMIQSRALPELKLTAADVFAAGETDESSEVN
ncbi:MAG: Uma2 family endonuclease [Spirulinaceae cyanobacterium]